MAAVRCTGSQDAHDGAPLAANGEVYTDENGARRSERGSGPSETNRVFQEFPTDPWIWSVLNGRKNPNKKYA